MEEEKKKGQKKPKSKARKIVEWVLTGIFGVLFIFLAIGFIDGMVHKNEHFGQNLKFGYGTFVVETDSMEKQYIEETNTYKKVYGVKSALITHLDSISQIVKDFEKGKTVDLTFYYDARAYNKNYPQPTNTTLNDRTQPAQYPIITHRLREVHVNPDANVKVGQGKYYFILSGINNLSTNLGSNGKDPVVINQYQAITEEFILGRVVIGSAFLGGVFGFVSSIWGLLILLLIPAFYLIITSVIDIFKAYKEPEEEGGVSSSSSSKGEDKPKGSVELSEADKKRLKEELLQEMLEKKKGGK